MNPVEIDGWCTLYHADSTEIIDILMNFWPAAVITDPPYGIGFVGVGGAGGNGVGITGPASHRGPGGSIEGDDKGADLSPWFSFAKDIWATFRARDGSRRRNDKGQYIAEDKRRECQLLFWGADKLHLQLPKHGRFMAWDKLGGLNLGTTFQTLNSRGIQGQGNRRL